ncbi:MAG TPA: ABC transporter permease [Anaerolineales bacterium]|nr:ABC transporter permease [Anaerolineales bacterium]
MLKRIWAITQKEFIQLFRIPLVIIGMPVGVALELVLFAVAIHNNVNHIPMAVADQSRSDASSAYLNAFTDSGSFEIVSMVPDQASVIHTIDSGQASIGLVIPSDFADHVEQKDANVLMVVDGSDSFAAQSAYSNAVAISQQYAISLIHSPLSPLNTHIQILYNPDLQDLQFIVPGFGAFLLFGIALKLTAFAIVREREAGTIEALLVTPIRPIELMIAKMIPNLVIAIFNLVMTFSMGILLFGVPFRGSLLLFSTLASLFAIGSLGLGLAISSISQSQVQANQLASLMNIAVMFLSGFMFPAYGLPLVLRSFGYVMPMTFFLPIVNGIITKGVGLNDLWPSIISLTVLTVVLFSFGALTFRQKLD